MATATTVPMAMVSQQELWDEAIRAKREQFLRESNQASFKVADFTAFQEYLHEVSTKFARKGGARAVLRLTPTLEYMKSFSAAIASATQANMGSTIVWAAVQGVIECATRFSNALEDISRVIAELNEAIPIFHHALIYFPTRPELHWVLRDLFDEYSDFCIRSIKYLKRNPAVNFVRFLIDPSPQRNIVRVKAAISRLCRKFDIEVKLAERDSITAQRLITTNRDLRQVEHNQMITQTLGIGIPSSQPISSIRSSNFPACIGRPLQNFNFVGRDGILEELHEALVPQTPRRPVLSSPAESPPAPAKEGEKRGPACAVLHGMAGIGKTQTALQYSYLHEAEYDLICWLKSETIVELRSSYARIACRIGALSSASSNSSTGSGDPRLGVEATRTWLEQTDKTWLLIFDNVEEIDEIAEFVPNHLPRWGSIIITTQRPQTRRIVDCFKTIKVDSLSQDDGSRLLRKSLTDGVDSVQNLDSWDELMAARSISEYVGGLPLAITTIGGYITESMSTPSEFHEHLMVSNLVWTAAQGNGPREYERTLGDIFDIAIRELNGPERNLLYILAFLNPDVIPEDMLSAEHQDETLKFLNDKRKFLEMKRVLNRRQLVKREFSDDGTPYLSIHRSLQLSILDKLSNDADLDLRQRTFQQAFALVKQQLPEASAIEVCPPEVWQVYLKYVPQLNSLRLHSLWPEPPLKLSDDFAKVLVDVGTYMWNTGLFKECEVAISLAETILETLPYEQAGELMTVVDGIMAKISDLTGVSKRSEGLRRCLRRVESRRKFYAAIPTESVTRTDEIRLFNSEADVGYTLMQDNRFTEAEEIYERCLVAYKSWSLIEEEIPFEYAKYYHHMAHVRALQGRLVEALALGSHAIKLQELHNRGPLSPMVQLYRFSYGMHLYHAGHLLKSLEIHEDVLKTRIQISGALNPWTLDSYSAVGMLLSLLGNHIKAEEHFAKCIDPHMNMHWSEENIAQAHFRNARVMHALGRQEDATVSIQKAYATRDKLMRLHPQFLKEDPGDESAVFNQMIPIWSGRFSQKVAAASLANQLPDLSV